MADIKNIVLIHGWGLNSAIWDDYVEKLCKRMPDVSVYPIDLPGYGHCHQDSGASDLSTLAKHCLAQAPQKALWVGWSLGGMVAMRAAIDNEQRIQGLQLINTTPKFTVSNDWPCGVDVSLFRGFAGSLSTDYQRTLNMFLLLQAGASQGARTLARKAQRAVCSLPQPSAETLMAGIDCLAESDLRDEISKIKTPTQILFGRRDRVTNPRSSKRMAALFEESARTELLEFDCGHAPFLTRQTDTLDSLLSFVTSLNAKKTDITTQC